MSDFVKIYEDKNIKLISRSETMQDTPDEARTIIIEIGDKKFGFEFAFEKLIHTWQK